jgi:hypothetical protein
MTARVINCTDRSARSLPAGSGRAGGRGQSLRNVGIALLAMGAVAYLGAIGVIQTWSMAVFAVAGLVWLSGLRARRVRWGVLALLFGGSLAFVPNLAALAACLVCAWQWRLRRASGSAQLGEAERDRAAAQMAGWLGELKVAATLERELPDSFVIVNGLLLPRGAGDIDHIVVGPTGVFLLETKTMAGRITCAPDGAWRRTRTGRGGTAYAAFIGDPAAQVERNIRTLRSTVASRAGRLARDTQLWIEGLIVFAHPDAELEADQSRVCAVRLADLAQLIASHTPRRALKPREVDQLVDVVLAEVAPVRAPSLQHAPAQAVVETALALPLMLALALGIVALSRVVQAQTALVGVVHEAARSGALANTPGEATLVGVRRGDDVAAGYGLQPDRLQLSVDAGAFISAGRVTVDGSYRVQVDDLPVLGWAPSVTVSARHEEWVDPYRSGVAR